MTKAIILSGGKGTRLMPLTKDTPKPMLPINGVPHLEYIIRLLKVSGVIDIIFSTGYLHEKIVDHFTDGSKFGVNIVYREDGVAPLGTAGAIKNCEDLLDGDDNVIVINGDILTDVNLIAMAYQHVISYSASSEITMLLTEVDNPEQFGVALTDDITYRINGFVEKPKEYVGNKINAGIYIISKRVIEQIPKNEYKMLESDVFPILAKQGKLYWYSEKDMYWIDIGTHERYNTANEDVKKGIFNFF